MHVILLPSSALVIGWLLLVVCRRVDLALAGIRASLRFLRRVFTFRTICLLVAGLVIMMSLSGCSTLPSGPGARWWNPLTWGSDREARAADRAEALLQASRSAEEQSRAELLRSAQRNAHGAALALLSAPSSRPVEVATEAAHDATASLDQALGALPAEQVTALRQQIAGLLSENASLRAEAEAARAATRAEDAAESKALLAAQQRTQEAAAAAAAAGAELRAGFARENELANQLRQQRWMSGLAAAAGVLSVAFGFVMRTNFLGLARGAGEAIGTLRAKYGVKDEDVQTLTSLLDAPTSAGTQHRVAKIASDTIRALLAAEASARRPPSLSP
jgi:regulator of replication initiation timing